MRTYVCAQCHVEYYFLGDDKTLTFPWSQGYTIDDIEAHYDLYGFKDWTHAETNAPMIKIQHPEFELWTTGLHAESGVACADCHMPYVREGGLKVSDHWLRSPLTNVNNACQTCHRQDEAALINRINVIQESYGRAIARRRRGTAGRDGCYRCRAGGWGDGRPARERPLPPPPGLAALGLHLLGEQHRLPQPSGVGARTGRRDQLRPAGAIGSGAAGQSGAVGGDK
jgi:hypothetical protein